MTETHRGRCLCKAVSFEIDIPETCVNCHCESCRRQCSSPMTTYIGVLDKNWRWTGEIPKTYRSSPGVERTFCGQCGTPLSFRSERMSGVMHLYVAAMEEPERFRPQLHVAYEEKLSWLTIEDDLPKRNGPEYL
ncbi:MAG: GFA family protein [Gammaproteobacteria bacterium]|nr:GFA family protein [Gammaproteobacteria bacterium]